ncbi:hypothetical protein K1W69_13210 [Hoeflea sp. WL0058]|uniref:Uncharacterized protein n=2 Tax=Flavimaribacter sediminis TaxID=2865987 RepID=A0AAE2ZJV7_9HYPH|nr:hypothetical protein [Flavimaribacter sediminis]
MNPAATDHLPSFVAMPGQTDTLFFIMLAFLIAAVLMIGTLYLKLHALPEHLAHRTSKVQYEVVAILALIALFTHNAIFWIAALLLAMIDLPDLTAPLSSMARSLEKLSGRRRPPGPEGQSGVLSYDEQAAAAQPFPWQRKG